MLRLRGLGLGLGGTANRLSISLENRRLDLWLQQNLISARWFHGRDAERAKYPAALRSKADRDLLHLAFQP
jgi:hypothetical protein